MLFIGAALVAAWYGGAAAGTVALLLGLFLADYFFITRETLGPSTRIEVFHFVRYVFTASLGIILIEVLHRNRRKLEQEIARRKQSEAELLQAHNQLRQYTNQLDNVVAERTASLTATVEYLRSLLYHIAHNLRAPLRAVRGFTGILGEEYGSKLDSKARQYSKHICDAAARMDELIHDLLEYGRLGYVEVKLSRVNLEEVLERVLFRAAHQIRTRHAGVEVVHPMPLIRGNAELLEQVLANLVENAIKFVEPGRTPRVKIHAQHRDAKIRVWIQDNGIGIEPRYHERIFGVFETLYPHQVYEGNGIGLAIVKQAVTRMGGQVGLESAPGAGSRFWIELPEVSNGKISDRFFRGADLPWLLQPDFPRGRS